MTQPKHPPRVLVCEIESPVPGERIFNAEEKGCTMFRPEYYKEYLSVDEHLALLREARAEAFVEAAHMFPAHAHFREMLLEKAAEIREWKK